jgi:hypothetical protein
MAYASSIRSSRQKQLRLEEGVDLQRAISRCSMAEVLTALEPYAKFKSLACMAYADVPILPVFLFNDWNQKVEHGAQVFCRRLSLRKVLIRSEASWGPLWGQSYSAVPIGQIDKFARRLFSAGSKMVALHPEVSIHRDEYSVNIQFDALSNFRVILEIIGSGFTATHLTRGGFIHERLELCAFGAEYDMVGARRVWRISDDAYQRDVQTIIDKYGYDLLAHKQSLLLEHEKCYTPIPAHLIRRIHSLLGSMREAISYMNFSNAIVSMSFFRPENSGQAAPVFWDFYELPMTPMDMMLGEHD